MSGLGYVVRPQHIRAAIERATSVEAPHLERCLELVIDLDSLERSLPDRIQKARTEADMQTANFLDNEVPDDDPTKSIHSGIYRKKREFVASLREFLAETGK